ncbi:hypothetical protein, conserved [Babesia bigemina]|uniref:Uncharacterized protein n=1 Tax=Babesia bigemina TaxID=5866 RepID=A0A061BK50_BABBI|nr:hypothetical protein, conserved [Babesia bigemina]CDR71827.1 hypothetical protein, conserved [Babesia bigemina]|eukprot:XP_012770770.1 hypothetical protein, conserved [Babesia bigemina]
MGFLSGVLEAVKNTQTYNVGKNTLNSVCNVINTHLCSGHDGFTKLLPSLTREIGRYNTEVRDSNEKVKKPIEELLNEVGDAFKNKVNDLLSGPNDHENVDKVQAAEKQVNETLANDIKTFTNKFNVAFQFKDNKVDKAEMKTAIRYLNPTLQVRVNSALKAVHHEIKRLEELSTKEHKNLEATTNLINAKLTEIKCTVTEQIKLKINELVEGLRNLLKFMLSAP